MVFDYQVVAASGNMLSAQGEAASAAVLVERLEKQGFQVIEVHTNWRRTLARAADRGG